MSGRFAPRVLPPLRLRSGQAPSGAEISCGLLPRLTPWAELLRRFAAGSVLDSHRFARLDSRGGCPHMGRAWGVVMRVPVGRTSLPVSLSRSEEIVPESWLLRLVLGPPRDADPA